MAHSAGSQLEPMQCLPLRPAPWSDTKQCSGHWRGHSGAPSSPHRLARSVCVGADESLGLGRRLLRRQRSQTAASKEGCGTGRRLRRASVTAVPLAVLQEQKRVDIFGGY